VGWNAKLVGVDQIECETQKRTLLLWFFTVANQFSKAKYCPPLTYCGETLVRGYELVGQEAVSMRTASQIVGEISRGSDDMVRAQSIALLNSCVELIDLIATWAEPHGISQQAVFESPAVVTALDAIARCVGRESAEELLQS
jgi:hypothetical protein